MIAFKRSFIRYDCTNYIRKARSPTSNHSFGTYYLRNPIHRQTDPCILYQD
jgi:hypothetical protein